jgi:hypothetical protein
MGHKERINLPLGGIQEFRLSPLCGAKDAWVSALFDSCLKGHSPAR